MPISILSRFKSKPAVHEDMPVMIVSGLPRSGTSMMMKMLEAGGIPPLTDQIRASDENNPKGYYEFERVKKLKDGDFQWLEQAQGKVVKVISALLEYLPDRYPYKVIFMQRNMLEILASQKHMLIRNGEDPYTVSDEKMMELYHQHLSIVKSWLAKQANIATLYINYNQILENPTDELRKVNDFLGGNLDINQMAATTDLNLYRERQTRLKL